MIELTSVGLEKVGRFLYLSSFFKPNKPKRYMMCLTAYEHIAQDGSGQTNIQDKYVSESI